MKLDNWQQQVLATKGNIVLRSGRQVGKSTVIGIKAAKYALENPKKTIMIISKTERQAGLLFTKILFNLTQINKSQILKGKDRPIKSRILLKNGSAIHCLPAGETGYGIMGFTIDLLIADEAAFIPEEVWLSVIPALAITRGEIWLLSTPFVKKGYYYECFSNPTFTSFHMSSEDCPRKDQQFLDHKKQTLTKAQYAQMYLGEFRDELRQFFSDKLIQETCILKRQNPKENRRYVIGVDVAGMGEDESTFEILDIIEKNNIVQVENLITTKTRTTDTTEKIMNLDKIYNFHKIAVDSGGMGVGVFDQLMLEDKTKRRTIGMNNAKKVYARDSSGKEIKYKKKTLLKEEMYHNLLRLMERKEIKLLDDDELKLSLKSIQGEYIDDKHGRRDLRIFGSYSHIAEGLIRAAWFAQEKSLNIWIKSIKI